MKPWRLLERWRNIGVIIGLGLGLSVGGVAVASTLLSQTPPGAPQDTALANVVTVSRSGTSTVELGPAPKGTTSISLTLICRSVGTFDFPDNSSASCSPQDLSQPPPSAQEAIEVVPLSPGQHSVTITATPGAKWTLKAVYIRRVITPWRTNAHGQTYGQVNLFGSPDLVQVVLQRNGHQGYAKTSDLNCASGRDLRSLAEAGQWTAESRNRNVSIPVYESDGTTVIGSMDIGTPSGPGIDTVPVSSLYAQCREGSSPTTTLPSTPVRVPNVVGMTSTQAGNALAKLHLAMDVGLTQVTSADRVASQAPTAGALVEPGTVVAVRFSAS